MNKPFTLDNMPSLDEFTGRFSGTGASGWSNGRFSDVGADSGAGESSGKNELVHGESTGSRVFVSFDEPVFIGINELAHGESSLNDMEILCNNKQVFFFWNVIAKRIFRTKETHANMTEKIAASWKRMINLFILTEKRKLDEGWLRFTQLMILIE